MKPIIKSQRSVLQHFKSIARDEVPHTLRWFDDQRLENHWCLTIEEQLALLGNVSPSLYERWIAKIESGVIPALNDDVMRRLSVLVGIHKSLTLLTPDNRPDYAVRWFLTPNNSDTCAGQSIKAYLLANNTMEGYRTIEAYLADAVISSLGGAYT
jgi:hypothetical protein